MNYAQLRIHISRQKTQGLKSISLILKGMSPSDYRRLDGTKGPTGKIVSQMGNDDVVLFLISEVEEYLDTVEGQPVPV